MALEHHKAAILLIARKLTGTAFSIMRIQFEAYIRGVWLHQCATETELSAFTDDRLNYSFAELVTAVEELEGFSDGILMKAKTSSWKAMCSFTHTGYLQAIRRNKAATLEPDYEDEELVTVLGFTNAIAILAGLEITHMANATDISNELLNLAQSVAVPEPKS